MKLTFSLFIVVLSFCFQANATEQHKLSTTLNETRMGKWAQHDFTVWIELDDLEQYLKQSVGSFVYTLNNYSFPDSSGIIFYKNSIERYEVAIEQLKKASHGFDLRKLIVYRGAHLKKNDVGNSSEIESRVKLEFIARNAVVHFKGKRIDALEMKQESTGDNPLNHGTCTTFYYQNLNQVLFKDCVIYGW